VGVEVDTSTHHGSWSAQRSDRLRDRVLSVAGWRIIRVTPEMWEKDGEALLADLDSLIQGAALAIGGVALT
jgi:very-short-patch-repair endonuclease